MLHLNLFYFYAFYAKSCLTLCKMSPRGWENLKSRLTAGEGIVARSCDNTLIKQRKTVSYRRSVVIG